MVSERGNMVTVADLSIYFLSKEYWDRPTCLRICVLLSERQEKVNVLMDSFVLDRMTFFH